jgi:hypothetical protein
MRQLFQSWALRHGLPRSQKGSCRPLRDPRPQPVRQVKSYSPRYRTSSDPVTGRLLSLLYLHSTRAKAVYGPPKWPRQYMDPPWMNCLPPCLIKGRKYGVAIFIRTSPAPSTTSSQLIRAKELLWCHTRYSKEVSYHRCKINVFISGLDLLYRDAGRELPVARSSRLYYSTTGTSYGCNLQCIN